MGYKWVHLCIRYGISKDQRRCGIHALALYGEGHGEGHSGWYYGGDGGRHGGVYGEGNGGRNGEGYSG